MKDALLEASRSGLYRAERAQEVLDAARACGLRVARVRLRDGEGKKRLLEAIAAELHFPHWFGGNWDALEDCLTDLGWAPAPGYLILIEGSTRLARDDLSELCDVLMTAAARWAEQGKPFHAVLVGGPRKLPGVGGLRRR